MNKYRKRIINFVSVAILVLLAFLIITGYLIFSNHFHQYEDSVFQENEKQMTVASTIISVYLNRFMSDTNLISDIAINEINNCLEESGDLESSLIDTFSLALERNEFAYQIRYLDEMGMEKLRMDKHDNLVSLMPNKLLQDKSNRYYFKEGMKRNYNELYFSPIDLNVENGLVELPNKPTIRVTRKVFSESGKLNGLIVINYDVKMIFSLINQFTQDSHQMVDIVNADSYWLNTVNPDLKWGFMYEDKQSINMKEHDPELWDLLTKEVSGDYKLDQRWITFSKFNSLDQNLYLIVEKPFEQYLKNESSYILNIIMILSIVLILMVIILVILVRYLNTRHEIKLELEKQVYVDALTGIENRLKFNNSLTKMIKMRNQKFALLFIDLDGFKKINDTFGHDTGDQVLIDVAQRLVRTLRDTDQVFRLGGDEFTILAGNLKRKSDVEVIAGKVIETLRNPFVYGDKIGHIGASVGISVYPDDALKDTELLSLADNLMYEVKKEGKNNFKYKEESAD